MLTLWGCGQRVVSMNSPGYPTILFLRVANLDKSTFKDKVLLFYFVVYFSLNEGVLTGLSAVVEPAGCSQTEAASLPKRTSFFQFRFKPSAIPNQGLFWYIQMCLSRSVSASHPVATPTVSVLTAARSANPGDKTSAS
jgi:hypothetical protein